MNPDLNKPVVAWVEPVKALAAGGLSDPGVLVFVLMKGDIVLPCGRFEAGGSYPRALATIAAALGTDAEAVQTAYVARTARRSDSAKLIEDGRAALHVAARVLTEARVNLELPRYAANPDHLTEFTRFLVKGGTASLPPPRPSPSWRRLFEALRRQGVGDVTTFVVFARFRRVSFDSGEVAEPLEETEALLTAAEALGAPVEAVRHEVEHCLKAASVTRGPNYARLAIDLEPLVAQQPGVSAVEFTPSSSAIVAKRTINGKTPAAPWEAFGEPPSSLRWRMGAGEDFLDVWHPYWESLDAEDRGAYLAGHPPPPVWRDWLGWTEDESSGQAARRTIHFYRVNEPFGFLSNFARCPIMLDGRRWATTEHYFQGQKFVGTPEEEQVRAAPSPGEAARLGRTLPGIRPDWEVVRDDVMMAALRAKFSQHPFLRAQLLETGDALLVERTKNDSYWADGGDGSGRNRLGELLMRVREELRGAG